MKEVFEEVQLGFLPLVIHMKVDGCFGYLSKKLKEKKFTFW
jgi:hypothetical protein